MSNREEIDVKQRGFHWILEMVYFCVFIADIRAFRSIVLNTKNQDTETCAREADHIVLRRELHHSLVSTKQTCGYVCTLEPRLSFS